MKIRDIMRPGPITIGAGDSLGTAQRVMARSHVRHLPVISGSRLVGMLSERDVLAARARAGADDDWWAQPVEAAMSTPPQTAAPDDSLTEIAGRMAVSKIGAMPVVELGQLLGIATVSDVLDAEVREAMAPAPIRVATAADAMTPWPYFVSPDAMLTDAVMKMFDHHIRHLPVVDGRSTVVGMLSERDVRSAVGDPVQFLEMRGPVRLHVRDVMTYPVVAVPFDRPLLELARAFADHRLGALPIVDKFGALIGIVSYVDALRLLAR
jgi:acetoin utilization protein AcuB